MKKSSKRESEPELKLRGLRKKESDRKKSEENKKRQRDREKNKSFWRKRD